jgi:CheY-like chemotaxis protein
MDGKSLADRARSIRAPLKVLITTAYAGSALVHEGRLDAGVELLSKPFPFAALASRIRELLDRPQPSPADPRILVVDDEALIRMLLVDMLSERGLLAEEAGTFHEALAKFRNSNEPLAAAIIDLGLPDGSGDELVASIRASRPDLPVILATGHASEQVRRRFADDPLLQIVTKPFDPAILLTTLAKFGVDMPNPQAR